jgi:stage II sporulation protein D (peptidoglycan lytic transglycosylase)
MVSKVAIALLALPLTASDLRIGVLSLFRPERVTVRSSQVLWVQAGSRTFFMTPGQVAGMRAVGADVDLFAQQQMTSSPRVLVSGRGGAPIEFSLNIEGKIDRKFKGRLEVTAIGSRLEPVIKVDLESAVAAVVAAEMPRNTPEEALKAMAVLARSYYVAGGRRHGNYDFCDTTHCQWRRETIAESHPATTAAQSTAGIIVLYKDRPFAPMYHASCGGRTKSASQIGLESEPYPYFPVECEPCRREATAWTRRLPQDLARPLLTDISESLRLDITRQLGWNSLPGNTFKATADGDTIVVEGKGEGHGVGVCQHGIVALARAGQEFRALLVTYLPQTRTGSVQ